MPTRPANSGAAGQRRHALERDMFVHLPCIQRLQRWCRLERGGCKAYVALLTTRSGGGTSLAVLLGTRAGPAAWGRPATTILAVRVAALRAVIVRGGELDRDRGAADLHVAHALEHA